MSNFISLKHAMELTGCYDRNLPVSLATGTSIRANRAVFYTKSELIQQIPYILYAQVKQILPANTREKRDLKCQFCFVLNVKSVKPTGMDAYTYTLFNEQLNSENIFEFLRFNIRENITQEFLLEDMKKDPGEYIPQE